MQVNVDGEVDEVEFNVCKEKVQQWWRYTDQRQESLTAYVDDSKSNVKALL